MARIGRSFPAKPKIGSQLGYYVGITSGSGVGTALASSTATRAVSTVGSGISQALAQNTAASITIVLGSGRSAALAISQASGFITTPATAQGNSLAQSQASGLVKVLGSGNGAALAQSTTSTSQITIASGISQTLGGSQATSLVIVLVSGRSQALGQNTAASITAIVSSGQSFTLAQNQASSFVTVPGSSLSQALAQGQASGIIVSSGSGNGTSLVQSTISTSQTTVGFGRGNALGGSNAAASTAILSSGQSQALAQSSAAELVVTVGTGNNQALAQSSVSGFVVTSGSGRSQVLAQNTAAALMVSSGSGTSQSLAENTASSITASFSSSQDNALGQSQATGIVVVLASGKGSALALSQADGNSQSAAQDGSGESSALAQNTISSLVITSQGGSSSALAENTASGFVVVSGDGQSQSLAIPEKVRRPDINPLLELQADTLNLNNGDPVSLWADQSGNGHDFTQTGSARPTKQTIGGYPAVVFDGVDDYLIGGDFADNLSDFAVFVLVYLPAVNSGLGAIITKGNDIFGVASAGWYITDYGIFGSVFHAGFVVYSSVQPNIFVSNNWHISTLKLNFIPANSDIFVDGVSCADREFVETVTNISNSESVRIGTDGNHSLPFSDAKIRAMMILSPSPNNIDRATMEAWLADRYGIWYSGPKLYSGIEANITIVSQTQGHAFGQSSTQTLGVTIGDGQSLARARNSKIKTGSLDGALLNLQADTLNLNDGDPVSLWQDQSGSSHDFTQTGNARPTKQTKNGYSAVYFDGIDDYMIGDNFADNLPLFACFAVYQSPTNSTYSFLEKTNINEAYPLWGFQNARLEWYDIDSNGVLVRDIITTQYNDTSYVISAERDGDLSARFFVNGDDSNDVLSLYSVVGSFSNAENVLLGLYALYYVHAILIFQITDLANWPTKRAAIASTLALRYGVNHPFEEEGVFSHITTPAQGSNQSQAQSNTSGYITVLSAGYGYVTAFAIDTAFISTTSSSFNQVFASNQAVSFTTVLAEGSQNTFGISSSTTLGTTVVNGSGVLLALAWLRFGVILKKAHTRIVVNVPTGIVTSNQPSGRVGMNKPGIVIKTDIFSAQITPDIFSAQITPDILSATLKDG